jgi:hypothetical protein
MGKNKLEENLKDNNLSGKFTLKKKDICYSAKDILEGLGSEIKDYSDPSVGFVKIVPPHINVPFFQAPPRKHYN